MSMRDLDNEQVTFLLKTVRTVGAKHVDKIHDLAVALTEDLAEALGLDDHDKRHVETFIYQRLEGDIPIHLGVAASELTPAPRVGSNGCCIGHCCINHGCKYGYDDCLVVTGKEKQEYECLKGAWCGEPGLFEGTYDPYEGDREEQSDG